MNALIVGADYIDQIKRALAELGVMVTAHWTGRKPGDLKRVLPAVDVVVIITNFVRHALTAHVLGEARRAGVPVLYARRSVADVRGEVGSWLGRREVA